MNKLIIEGKEIPLSDETVKAIKDGLKEEQVSRKPKVWEGYYIIDSAGGVYQYKVYEGTDLCCNYYKTEAEARKKSEWLMAVERVKEYMGKEFINNEYIKGDNNYYFFYDEQNEWLWDDVCCSLKLYSPIWYLKSDDDCEKLIANCNDDLLIIYK